MSSSQPPHNILNYTLNLEGKTFDVREKMLEDGTKTEILEEGWPIFSHTGEKFTEDQLRSIIHALVVYGEGEYGSGMHRVKDKIEEAFSELNLSR